jgi:putative endonuclease
MRRAAFVYLLRCNDGTIYTGWTFDVTQRVRAHQDGRGARYTRIRRPVELVYQERLSSRRAAMRREIEIKKMSRVRKQKLAEKVSILIKRKK